MNRRMRTILTGAAIPLWIAAITFCIRGLLVKGAHDELAFGLLFGQMAITGTLCGQLRENAGNDKTGDMVRDAAKLILRAIQASHTQPTETETGLRVVPDEEPGREHPFEHRSAG